MDAGLDERRGTGTREDIAAAIVASFEHAARDDAPFTHWTLRDLLPRSVVAALAALSFNAPDVSEESGRREVHNDARHYFAGDNLARHRVMTDLAAAFLSPRVTEAVVRITHAKLAGTALRIEYCVDTNGFWLEPHTDVGVKAFTLLYQLATGRGQRGLGTDLYERPDGPARREPFVRNAALVFVPSAHSWHGFERRQIAGLRRSIIVNYVGSAWRAREQLAFGGQEVGLV